MVFFSRTSSSREAISSRKLSSLSLFPKAFFLGQGPDRTEEKRFGKHRTNLRSCGRTWLPWRRQSGKRRPSSKTPPTGKQEAELARKALDADFVLTDIVLKIHLYITTEQHSLIWIQQYHKYISTTCTTNTNTTINSITVLVVLAVILVVLVLILMVLVVILEILVVILEVLVVYWKYWW